MFPVIFTVDGNRAGMMLRMSCARLDASRDRIGVAGIFTNDGRECGGREKLQSLVDVVVFKITTLVARVSLVATVMLGPQLCRLPFRVLV